MIVNLDSNDLNHGFQNKLFITKDKNTKKMFLWIYQNKIEFKEGKKPHFNTVNIFLHFRSFF